jgi:RNA polymerase sigma-54 factor
LTETVFVVFMSSLKLSQKLDQRMVLTPQLRQRIEMLQMNVLEMSELIQQELNSNPVLEEVGNEEEVQEISENILDQNAGGFEDYETSEVSLNGAGPTDLAFTAETGVENGFNDEYSGETDFEGEAFEAVSEKSDSFEEVDFGTEFKDYLDPGYKTQEIEYKEDAPSFEQFLTRSESLMDHLEWQINLLQISDYLQDIAVSVVGNLDEDGRLRATLEEIAEMHQCPVETVEKARQIVMRLDPVGCGALNVNECLIVQLDAQGEGDSLAVSLIRDHFEDLQPFRLQHLSKQIGISLQTINEEIHKIRQLEPFPGRRFSSDDPIYVAPEVKIEKIDEDYVIYFMDDGSPRLRISHTYQKMLDQGKTTKEEKDFIKDNIRSAIDLLRNIEHRRQTIYRVVECIVKRQREFLDKGVEYIKPMMLKDVAEDIGMHLSTISRVVNRKYAYTPQGVIELRRFFSEGMLNEDGEEVSTRIIKLRIKKLIEEEDSRKPITDDDIAKILSKEGIKLSRRTVAKYRDQMQIPGSRERKTVV